MQIIFPSEYYNVNKIDPDYEPEYDAAREEGFETALFSFDEFMENGKFRVSGTLSPEAVYRGWMMLPDKYRNFYEILKEKGCRLRTSPEEYETCHLFSGVYPHIMKDTAKAFFFPEGSLFNGALIQENFHRFMIKDYVKSAKNTSFPELIVYMNWSQAFYLTPFRLYITFFSFSFLNNTPRNPPHKTRPHPPLPLH